MLSDEIHQDLCQPEFVHISVYAFEEYQDLTVCMNPPAKTFNLALNLGSEFRGEEYGSFIRINVSTSKEKVSAAAENIVRALKQRKNCCVSGVIDGVIDIISEAKF